MKISFVIPCYRSEKTLEGVVAEIKSTVAQRSDVDYEIIMVSDHSPDNVYSVIERLASEDPKHCRGLELSRNFGQPGALMAGYSRVTGDVAFALDDDGQAPVDAIYTVVDKLLNENLDLVYGSYPIKRHNIFRNFGSRINHWMAVWLVNKPAHLRSSSFNATRRYVVDELMKYKGPYPYIGGLFYRITNRIGSVDVNHRSRIYGASGYTFVKLLSLWMNGFTSFSVKPLRIATWAGVLCSSLGFAFGFWTVFKKLFVTPSVALGYSSIMATLLFIGGMLMLILGLLGEYIGRIYICINQSPQYVVAKETKGE